MEIEITVNLGALATLDRRLGAALDRALHAGTEDGTMLLLREMKVYPAQRRGSTYKRTNVLKGSWHKSVKRASGGWSGEVLSSGMVAPYNVWVQKAGLQAEVHRGRWPTEQSVAARLQPHIVRMYQERVGQAARSGG